MDVEDLTISTADLALGLRKDPLPWCFRCRKFSHVMRNCPLPSPDPKIYLDTVDKPPDLDDFLDEFHKKLSLHIDRPLTVCQRCEYLNFPQLFQMPWTDNFQTNPLDPHRYPPGLIDIVAPDLGEGGTTVFLSSCPLCHLLIMSMLRAMPHDTQQLQIQRLMTTFIEDKGVSQSQSEVTAMVKQSKAQGKQHEIFLCPKMPWPAIPKFGTRIGIYISQAGNRTCQFVVGETDFEMIGFRIEECITSHGNCQDPDIDFWQFDTSRLVDVRERKIVLFDTSTPPDYVALSYVWGPVKQISYPLNTTLPQLPQTIEDAMTVVRKLGKRYLWVDSLCIDQTNDEHKQSQIMIMHEIYHYSWATIVDLSGTSAKSGLSRVHTDWFPRQLRREIDGHQFVSGLPHLLAYAKQSPWSERGWVLQEAMLSRRCIIFTRSQVYFECNEWQFSETFPTVVVDPPSRKKSFKKQRQFSTGVFRMTGNQSLRSTEQRLQLYSQLLVDYKKRKITYPSDSLNAFSAILFDLIGKIKSHFSNGLPIEYMPWALGWKQKCMGPMRSDFLSWSWATWDGPLSVGVIEPIDRYHSGAEGFQPYFAVVATDQWNQPSTYTRNVDQHYRWGGREGAEDTKHLQIKNMQFEDLVGETTKPSQTALQITGVVFKLVVHVPEQPSKALGGETIYHVYIENEELDIYVTPSESPSELRARFHGDAQDFLMLARVDSLKTIMSIYCSSGEMELHIGLMRSL